ncbi:MAG: NADP-dependent oxidoreductase [Glaciihabitans sp.]|nr:NADP-dependent oxidoreductase [Glaciihabitans sp.]
MSRFVQFSGFGGPDVLDLVDVEPPHPGPGQVRVAVRVAGLNPVDYKIFGGGPSASQHGSFSFPSGNGNDFSGVVDEVGESVHSLAVGDRVFGGARFHAQADFLVIEEEKALRMPDGLGFDVAGGLDIAGRAAIASVRSVSVTAGDTVLVSAAAGGVGVIAAQLALLVGATVIGTASASNHEFLRGLGIIPVGYGGDGSAATETATETDTATATATLVDGLREVAPQGITAVLDCNGAPTIDAALELGVPAERINTIAARDHAARRSAAIRGVGGQAASPADLLELAHLVAEGRVTIPIDSVYPLERVREAYERLIDGHVRGKIILALA